MRGVVYHSRVTTPITVAFCVLIVDDDAELCDSLVLLLQDAGFDARCATRLDDAVQAIRTRPADLILCDWVMPDGGAADLAGRMAAEGLPEAPIVAMTGMSSGDLPPEFQDRMLPKPFGLPELLARIRPLRAATEGGGAAPDETSP